MFKDIPLTGKWIVQEPGNEYFIEITKDSIFRMYAHGVCFEKIYKIESISDQEIRMIDPEVASSQEPGKLGVKKESDFPATLLMTYQINGNQLTLINQETGGKTLAVSSQSEGLNAEKDYFRKVGLSIELPEFEGEERREHVGDLKIYIGQPNANYASLYGKEVRLWSKETFVEIIDLALPIDELKKNKEGQLLCYVDRKVEMAYLKNLWSTFNRWGVDAIYVATKSNTDQPGNLELRYSKVNLSALEIKDQQMNFENWLK